MKGRVLGSFLAALAGFLLAQTLLFVSPSAACPPGYRPRPGVTNPTDPERDCEPAGGAPSQPSQPKAPVIVPPSVPREKVEQLLRERMRGEESVTQPCRPQRPTDDGSDAIRRLGEKLRKQEGVPPPLPLPQPSPSRPALVKKPALGPEGG